MQNDLVEHISAKVAALPLEQQREALSLIEALEQRPQPDAESPSARIARIKGITAGSGPQLTLADLREARREMWGEYMEPES